eukprot:s1525_g6.t1
MTRARHERHRRDKEAQKRWLSEKRRGVQEDAQQGTAAEDFRSYYNAQFCHDRVLATEQAEFWSSMESALPVTVRVSSSPESSHTEARLASFGWHRRVEFDRTGLSVWEISSEVYSQDGRLRAWTERENRLGSLCFQELVSLIPPILLDPQPKEVCLDLCAAPGNKSLQLLESLASKADVEGAVLSADNDPQRCCLTLHRVLGKAASPASCAALANAAHFPVLLDQMDTELVDSGFGRLDFDRILADVPCSGDGTARKNTQVFRGWSRREALELSSLQRRILLRGLYLLPPQGTLVYSTCSLNPLENEAVVLSCLRRWNANLHSQGNAKMPVSLLDAKVMVEDKCGLRPSTGMTNWVVPAPQRGGPWFSSWEEVPEELCNAERFALRSDMFPAPGQPGEEATKIAHAGLLSGDPSHGPTSTETTSVWWGEWKFKVLFGWTKIAVFSTPEIRGSLGTDGGWALYFVDKEHVAIDAHEPHLRFWIQQCNASQSHRLLLPTRLFSWSDLGAPPQWTLSTSSDKFEAAEPVGDLTLWSFVSLLELQGFSLTGANGHALIGTAYGSSPDGCWVSPPVLSGRISRKQRQAVAAGPRNVPWRAPIIARSSLQWTPTH